MGLVGLLGTFLPDMLPTRQPTALPNPKQENTESSELSLPQPPYEQPSETNQPQGWNG